MAQAFKTQRSFLLAALPLLKHGGARCLWWRLFLFCLVTIIMPHCRSVAALAKRSDRALTLNYVQPRPLDRSHVAVPNVLAKDFKMVAKSMILHAEHDMQVGRPHYHARLATHEAKPLLDERQFKHAQRVHKAAGQAKHLVGVRAIAASGGLPSSQIKQRKCWADIEEDDYDVFDSWKCGKTTGDEEEAPTAFAILIAAIPTPPAAA